MQIKKICPPEIVELLVPIYVDHKLKIESGTLLIVLSVNNVVSVENVLKVEVRFVDILTGIVHEELFGSIQNGIFPMTKTYTFYYKKLDDFLRKSCECRQKVPVSKISK